MTKTLQKRPLRADSKWQNAGHQENAPEQTFINTFELIYFFSNIDIMNNVLYFNCF